MNTLTVEVPDETLAMKIDSWEDGAEYELTVRQISPGKFTAIEGEPAEMMGEEMTPEAGTETSPEETMPEVERPPTPMKKSIPAANESNPAIALVIAAGKKKRMR